MKKTKLFVSVIIVNYNGKHFLKDCFDSLLAMDYPMEKLEILMVDNGSSDGSLSFVQKEYPAVKVLQNDVNNYARANNLGIQHAQGEYIALANNDLVFDKGWLREMLKAVSANERIGAVAGKILFPDGSLQGAGHHELPNFYWSDRGFLEKDVGQYDQNEEIQSFSHCATLYRRKCLKETGPLDEDFNMFLEDVDMAVRARQKGWKFLYAPAARVFHKFHGTAKTEDVEFFCERNRLLLLAKHYPEKLSGALSGKGYFTALDHKKDLLTVLPEVLRKLITTHDQGTALSILPGIVDEWGRILNFEKDFLIKEKDSLIKELNASGKARKDLLENVLPQREGLIDMINGELARVGGDLAQAQGELTRMNKDLSERDQTLRQRNEQLAEADRRSIEKDRQLFEKDEALAQKDRRICDQESEIESLRLQIGQIFGSRTYRFLARPFWRVWTFLRAPFKRTSVRGSCPPLLVVIKPFCVNAKDTQKAIQTIRALREGMFTILVANSTPPDAAVLSGMEDVDEKISYDLYRRKFTLMEQIKLLRRLRGSKPEETIAIIGDPVPYGYSKTKALAFLSGAKRVSWYSLRSGSFQTFEVEFSLKALAGSISLFLVTALFCIFIVFPSMVLKKIRR